MGKEICVDCKRESYNCHDWCLAYLKAKSKNRPEVKDESTRYAIDKYWKLKKEYGGKRR